jgi:hypothetical protein
MVFCCDLNLGFATKIKAKQKGSELGTSQSKKKSLNTLGEWKGNIHDKTFEMFPLWEIRVLECFKSLGQKCKG